MELMLLDESVIHGALAGILLLIPAAWAAWAGAWLRRIELRPRAEATAAALGLRLRAEGWGPAQRAEGEVGAVPVRLRWRLGFGALRIDAAVGTKAPWVVVPEADEAGWVRHAVSTQAAQPPG